MTDMWRRKGNIMTVEELSKTIESLREKVMFGEHHDSQLKTDGASELTQLDIVACLDYLSLAQVSARKACLRQTREIAQFGKG